jgi:DNA mismatch endonuclease, patch repair protein
MPDVHTPSQRSYNMSRIKGKDTKPELLVRRFLFSKGFRYRVNYKRLPGKPDIVLPKYKTVIFVNGCFWHGHENCKYFKLPKTRRAWWKVKIDRNRSNETKNFSFLKKAGWKVIRIWTCDLKDRQEKTLNTLLRKFH